MIDTAKCDIYRSGEDDQPVPLTQAELNDLTRDLNISKDSAQVLGSRHLEKRLLAPGTTYYSYRVREREFRKFFMFDEVSSLVYRNNIASLIELLGLKYDAMEWTLFTDSPSRSLRAVLNIGNKFSSIPVGYSVQMKESHESMESLFSTLNYQKHKWLICGDLEIVGIILGLQGGYTKCPCFLCLWDSRVDDQCYVRQEWPSRQGLKPGLYNVVSHPLVESSKILLPPLYIKLGFINNFVKALDMEVEVPSSKV
ncbi:hypothetical protein FHG87_018235 [Trinorchestia longiramus]|nr:hypothetical protein FHG87_018235 [Trinorchestia longiramus]